MTNKVGQAGTLESCDALVIATIPSEGEGIEIQLDSPSLVSFEKEMRDAITGVLQELNVMCGVLKVQDRGALDCTLRARVETAVRRALAALPEGSERP
jgi:citrate lyase subunit gamma (acyl carrier protein)